MRLVTDYKHFWSSLCIGFIALKSLLTCASVSGTKSNHFERMLIDNLLMDYNTDVRPVENVSQVLEVTVGVQPYRLLRVVRLL